MPLKKTEWHAGYYRRQVEKKIIEPLARVYGVDFSEEKLLDAIKLHNEVSRIITEQIRMQAKEKQRTREAVKDGR